jgi:dihydrofolate reductase
MIVALGRNRVIGIDNAMPWHIPADLRYFRAKTMGKPVLMGRRTLESIGQPLPGRFNIVVTRDPGWRHPGVTVAASLEDGVAAAHDEARRAATAEAMIVGGGQVYRQLIHRADRLYLTEIDLAPDGHVFFPDYTSFGRWREISREHHPAAAGRPAFAFVVKDRC